MQMLRMGKLGGIVKFLPSNLQVSETEENKKKKSGIKCYRRGKVKICDRVQQDLQIKKISAMSKC